MKKNLSLALVLSLLISLAIPTFTAFGASADFPVRDNFDIVSGNGGNYSVDDVSGSGCVISAVKRNLDGLQIVIDLNTIEGSIGALRFMFAKDWVWSFAEANNYNGFNLSMDTATFSQTNSSSVGYLFNQTYHKSSAGVGTTYPDSNESVIDVRTDSESKITVTFRKDAVLGEWYMYINENQQKLLCLDEEFGRSFDDGFTDGEAWMVILFDGMSGFSMDFTVNENTAPGTGTVSYADFGGGFEVAGTDGIYNFDSARRINGIEVYTNKRYRLDGLQITVDLNNISGNLGWMFFSFATSGQGGYFDQNALNGFGWSINAAALNALSETSTFMFNTQTYWNNLDPGNTREINNLTARSNYADKITLTIRRNTTNNKYYLYRDTDQTEIICIDDELGIGRSVSSAFPDGKAQMNITFDYSGSFAMDFTVNELYNDDLGLFDVETISGVNYITGVAPKTSVGAFLRNTGISANVMTLFAADGTTPETNLVKTGTVVDIHGFGTAAVVIKSDVNGDGIFSALDIVEAKSSLLGLSILTPAQALAGNMNSDVDDEITVSDIVLMKKQMV